MLREKCKASLLIRKVFWLVSLIDWLCSQCVLWFLEEWSDPAKQYCGYLTSQKKCSLFFFCDLSAIQFSYSKVNSLLKGELTKEHRTEIMEIFGL